MQSEQLTWKLVSSRGCLNSPFYLWILASSLSFTLLVELLPQRVDVTILLPCSKIPPSFSHSQPSAQTPSGLILNFCYIIVCIQTLLTLILISALRVLPSASSSSNITTSPNYFCMLIDTHLLCSAQFLWILFPPASKECLLCFILSSIHSHRTIMCVKVFIAWY